MKIRILYDNTIHNQDYLSGWGFSCLINEDILFDCGEFAEILMHNAQQAKVDFSELQKVIISHDHYDHQGGLPWVLTQKDNLEVYLGGRFTSELKALIKNKNSRVIAAADWQEIAPQIYLTKDYNFTYKGREMSERGIVIRSQEGINLLTGCSHPGVVMMAEDVQNHFAGEPFYLLAGGFHLKDKTEEEIEPIVVKLKNMNIQNVAPTHCTGEIARDIFHYHFKDRCQALGAGKIIELKDI